MVGRFTDKAAEGRFPRLAASPILVALVLFCLAAIMSACGGDPEPASGSIESTVADAASPEDQEQHLRDLEVQLESLERQSEAMRREVLSRLDQIDVTREALAVQLMSLRGETAEPVEASSEATAAPAAPSTPAEPEQAAASTASPETAGEAPDSENNPFLRFLLLIFILAAIFFLARIFFDRWGDPEDGERPPTVEATTDLGKIRFPPGTEVRPEADDEIDLGSPDDPDGGRPGD